LNSVFLYWAIYSSTSSTLLTLVEYAANPRPGRTLSCTLAPALLPVPPSPTGGGGRNGSAVWRSPRHARHPTSPSPSGVEGVRAGPAGGQRSQALPCSHTSLVSPTWADEVRGKECASVEIPARPTSQPAVSSADFSALYERCLVNGLKAHVVFSHAAGFQVATIKCSLPTTSAIAATAKKRHHRRRRRRRRGRAATSTDTNTVRSPSTATATMTSAAPAGKSATTPIQAVSSTPPSSAQPVPSPSSPEATTPPLKRIRRRRNEVELLRGLEGDDDELLLSPLSGVASPPSFSPPSPSSRHTPPTTFAVRVAACAVKS
jgi:hypothetical protein